MTHDLKCWPVPFRDIQRGDKTCEIRKDDRGFKVQDKLRLLEFSQATQRFVGPSMLVRVTHIQRGFGLPDDLCVMSIKVLSVYPGAEEYE